MSTSGPLLRDIHVPPVPWWPPAIGWWLLAALVLIVIATGVLFFTRRRSHLRPRRAARRELELLAERFGRDRNAHALATGLSKLLRRVALLIEPAAATRGAAEWRAFLADHAPGAFDEAQLATLLEAPYRAHATFDGEALLASARLWCDGALRKRVRRRA